MLDLELAARAYEKETGAAPWKHADAPVIFGAASLTLTLLENRTSEDVDLALSSEFAQWWNKNGSRDGTANMADVLPFDVFSLCGHWQSRVATITGLKGLVFRVIHPLDTVMQKLLRVDSVKFDLKDKGDISKTIAAIGPTRETLLELLTENRLRYRSPIIGPNKRFKMIMDTHFAMKRNTEWMLSLFLPGTTYDDIVLQSEERYLQSLGSLAAPAPMQIPKTVAEILRARSIEL